MPSPGTFTEPIRIQRTQPQQLFNNPITLTNKRSINMKGTFRKIYKVAALFAVLGVFMTASLPAHAEVGDTQSRVEVSSDARSHIITVTPKVIQQSAFPNGQAVQYRVFAR